MPGFQYGNFVRSGALNQLTSSGWNTTSYVAGNLSLLEAWNRSQLSVNYSGGGSFSTDKSQGNDYYHQLGLIQAFNWKRWQLSFIDQFSYLPQTQFGFGAGTNLVTPGVGGPLGPSLPGLQTNYQPNQSVFTSLGPRYSNSITTQVIYAVSPRGSVTLSGSYGILRSKQEILTLTIRSSAQATTTRCRKKTRSACCIVSAAIGISAIPKQSMIT
jgi:hypothetical protein